MLLALGLAAGTAAAAPPQPATPRAVQEAKQGLGGNRVGLYTTCREVSIKTGQELHLQIDGNLIREGTDFRFRILPTSLRMKY